MMAAPRTRPPATSLDERIHQLAATAARIRERLVGSEFERRLALREMQALESGIRSAAQEVGQMLALILAVGDGGGGRGMNVNLAAQIDALHHRIARLEGSVTAPVPQPIARIIAAVCAHFVVGRPELLGEGQAAHLVLARHTAMALVRQVHGISLPRIGRAFRRDHTSVLHAVRRIAALTAADPAFAAQYAALAEVLTPDMEA